MNSKIIKKFVLALLLVAGTVAGWTILTTPGLKPVVISIYEPPQIHAKKPVHDVGTVNTDNKVEETFLIYNLGGKTLHIQDVETTCGCTVAALTQKSVLPGDFTTLTVALDTSIKVGPVRKKITVHSNDPDNPELPLFLTGTVVRKMEPHKTVMLEPEDPLVLFKGDCATCHVEQGKGKSGKQLFLADCAMCHGVQGTGHGNSGPTLLARDLADAETLAHVRKVIADGSPNTPQMPPFAEKNGGPLTEGQIDSLVNYLKFLHTQKQLGLLDAAEEDEMSAEDERLFQEALRQSR